jgi:hypothetical protein
VSPSDSRNARWLQIRPGSTRTTADDRQTQKPADRSGEFLWRHILALFENIHGIELRLRFRGVRVASQIATDLAVCELVFVLFNGIIHFSAA